jgi:hypothetical protein
MHHAARLRQNIILLAEDDLFFSGPFDPFYTIFVQINREKITHYSNFYVHLLYKYEERHFKCSKLC